MSVVRDIIEPMTAYEFTATIWEYQPNQPGSWHFLSLPVDVTDDLSDEAGPRRGFGSIPVVVRIGASEWKTSVFPDKASGCFLLPIKADVRRREGIGEGTPVACSIAIAAP